MRISRRRFGILAGSAVASLATACRGVAGSSEANDGRLTARPHAGATTTARGHAPLGLDRSRDAILHVPPSAGAAPLPLLVLLHGATGSGEAMLRRLGSTPDDAGVVVLSPDSRDGTWDAIRGGFGPDVTFLDSALQRVFDTVAVDPDRIAVGGFSDGATYALSIGLINGDLFKKIVAFSPGFIVPGPLNGRPGIFISHGTSDPILPIDQCSRQIVPALRTRGYDMTFREFNGGHTVPPEIAREGLQWVAASGSR
jgi:phospholipase/carboxylesterase